MAAWRSPLLTSSAALMKGAPGLPILTLKAWLRPVPAGALAPNSACTAASPKPWARAKSARLATSGNGASVVMTLSLLPRRNTCKSALSLADEASACRSSLSICPFSTPANCAPEWLTSPPEGWVKTSFPLGDGVGAVKKSVLAFMEISIL